jgi:predicted Zn-dependent protease
MNLLIAMVKSGQKMDLLVEPLGLAALRMPLLPSEIPADRREMIRTAGHAILSIEAQRRDEAEQLLHGMVAANPGEPGVHFLDGVFLLNVHPEDGIAEIQKELEISPMHVPAKLRLAEQYLKDQKMDQALALAQEAAKLEPTNGGAHMVLGEALVAKGDAAGGIRELEMAREQLPQTVRVRWDLLRAYAAAGRSDDAKREKEEIEKLSLPESGRQTD